MNPSPTLLKPTVNAASSAGTYYSVNTCIAELGLFFALQRQILRHAAGWLAGVPYWDAKLAIGEHILHDAHNAEALLKRLHELKALSAEQQSISGIDVIVGEVAAARTGDEWLRGLYTRLKPWLVEQICAYLRNSDPIMDAPSHEVLERMVANQRKQIAWFEGYTPRYSPWRQRDCREWCGYLDELLGRAAIADGELRLDSRPARPGDRTDFVVFPAVERDRTFRVSERRELPLDSEDFEEKRMLVFWAHAQEMQFAESLGAILYETPEMPWAFHHDLARHLSDEVRHSRMGSTRLEQLGHRLTDLPMATYNYAFRCNLDPLVRFCMMTLVMEANGFETRRANLRRFQENGDVVSELCESFDLRDEMLHTNFGHVWTPIMLRVYHDSRSVQELSQHCRDTLGQRSSEYPSLANSMKPN